jgi:hypothetical protein
MAGKDSHDHAALTARTVAHLTPVPERRVVPIDHLHLGVPDLAASRRLRAAAVEAPICHRRPP